ncbi:MAG: hypothetical protein FIA97_06505, partial [Methylococcaceae bacterium]|nr:hypothetical protein [Methylococcaceae bacterium]
MTNQMAGLIRPLRNLLEPLLDRTSSLESLEHLFYRYGWRISLEVATFETISAGLQAKTALEALLAVIEPLQQKLDGNTGLSSGDVADLARALDAVVTAISHFRIATTDVLPPPLNDDGFWQNIAEQIFDDLLEQYLRSYHPAYYLVLHASGVIDYRPSLPEGPFRCPYTRVIFDWRQIGKLIENPAAALKKTYQWGLPDQRFDHARFIDVLERVLRAAHLSIDRRLPGLDPASLPANSPYRIDASADALKATLISGVLAKDRAMFELGLRILVAAKANEPFASGLILHPVARGAAEGSLPFGNLALKWKAVLNAGEVLGVAVFPDTIALAGGQAVLGTSIELVDARPEPSYVFGTPHTSRLEVNNPSIRLSIEGEAENPEVRLRVGSNAPAGKPGARFIVPMDAADSVVKETVRKNTLELSFSPEMIWSSRSGLTFNGKTSLDVDIPIRSSFGGGQIHDLKFKLGRAGASASDYPAFELEASTALDVQLGPALAVIDRIGLLIGLDFATENKNLGFVDLSFGFKPPTGLGLSIQAPTVTGGGFLAFDPAKQEYAGMLQLEIAGTISVKAFGLLPTRMPDGRSGYSLAILIAAEGFAPIQLGFGFTLTGIGGLLGIHRTVAVDVLRGGIRSGTLGSLLFPADPIRNAPQIVSDLRAVFPTARNRHVFGPMAKIEWGTPTLLTLQLALILELPEPVRLIVLGRLLADLPSADHALVRLRMDAVGLIDFNREEISLDATLYDSRILEFALSGDMALRANWGAQPDFVLAVGGCNPRYPVPANFPPLRRLTLSLGEGDNPRLRFESYLAITSNTVQFGGRLDFAYSASGFTLVGFLGADALFQFEPFAFVVDIGAMVALKRGSSTLMSVGLDMSLAGPTPWHAWGKAKFKILFFTVKIGFDHRFGH